MICEEASGSGVPHWRPNPTSRVCSDPGGLKAEVLVTDLNPVEHQFVPQTVVAYDAAPELRLLPPNGVMKQSPS